MLVTLVFDCNFSSTAGEPCGSHGTCNTTIGICICKDGWSQNLEWNYGIEADALETSQCYFNETIVRAIYVCLFVFCVAHTVMFFRKVRSKRQFYKRLIFLVVAVCIIILSLLRIVDPVSGFGESYGYSLLYCVSIMLILYIGYDYLITYLNYVESKFQYMQSFRGSVSRKVFAVITVVGMLFLVVTSSLVLTDKLTNKSKGILVQATLSYWAVFYAYQTVFLFASLTEMINDMDTFLSLKSKAVLTVQTDHDKAYEKGVRKNLPKVKRTRIRFVVLGVLLLSVILIPVVLPDRYVTKKYHINLRY